MSRLALYLFGGFNAVVDDAPISGIYDHVRALLAYLAVESDRPHRREFLAELLWPDEGEEVARRNLRQALSRLRAALGERDSDGRDSLLLIDRATIQFNRKADHFFDVAAFMACTPPDKQSRDAELTPADLPWLEEACSLYRGHFLHQFYLPDNPSFDQWASTRTEEYKRRALTYLSTLTNYYESLGNLERAMETARRQLELEPWLESAHRQLMRLLAKSGQRSAALSQYNVCRSYLLEELGVDPEPETETLRQAILQGAIDPIAANSHTTGRSSGRRQVTVLYCGLAEPSGMDPEDFIDVVRSFKQRCREVATRFEAYLEDSHGGAQIMFFGFPHAHEDDAQRAVHASQRILAEVQALSEDAGLPLVIRGGVHTGLMVSSGGDATDLPLDMVGTPLGVAVQLRYQAEANSFLISADTERLVRGYFVLKEKVLSGSPELAAALPAHQVIRAAQARARIEASRTGKLSPFVGREVELADLVECWLQVRSGSGRLVVVEGEPGIGKSRFIHMFKRRLVHESHTPRIIRCSPDYQATALPPVVDLLHQTCEFRAGDPPETRLTKLAGTLERLGLDSELARALLAHLLGLPAARELHELEVTPQQVKQRTLALVADMQRVSAQQRPVLLVVEDLQWVDPTTLDFLKLLAKGLDRSPIMILLTTRPAVEHPWRKQGAAMRLDLGALSGADVRKLANAVARNKPLPEVVLEQIVARTDGVPLFVEELTKTLLESNLLRETHSRYELASPSPTVALPFTLHDSLMARLDRLESAKHVAQLAAVLGREFPYDMLADLADLPDAELQLELSRLMEAELLYQRQQGDVTVYGFRHALIQEVAYESLLRRHRQELHRRVAQQLEERAGCGETVKPELLAHHFQEAGLIEPSVRYWHRAGANASQLSAHVEAVNHLRRGMKLLGEIPEGETRDRLELDLCMTIGVPLMLSVGPVPELEQAYARALALAQKMPDSHDMFPAVRGLYTYYAGRADYQTAERLAQQLLRIAEEQQRDALLLEAHRALGTILLLRGEVLAAIYHLELTIQLYDPAKHHPLAFQYGMDPGLAAFSLLAVSDWITGFPDRARKRALDAIRLAQEWGHPSTTGWTLNIGLLVMELLKAPDLVLELSDQLTQLAEKYHMSLWTVWSGIMRDKTLADRGGDIDVLSQMGDAFARYDKIGAAMGRPYALALWAEVCLNTRHIEKGLEVVREALSWIGRNGARLHEAELHRLEGELLLASGHDPQGSQAEAAFNRALLLARAQSARSFELRAAISLARHLLNKGRVGEVRRLLEPLLGAFSEGLESGDLVAARALLDECEAALAAGR